MALYITSLASGSNGNCYYVGNKGEAVLIDAGISCKELEKRMKRLALSMQQVKALFVSHEHSDHIRGLYSVAKKYNLPIYISDATLRHSGLSLYNCSAKDIKGYEAVSIGALTITAFPKFHDASDPFSFIIESEGIKVGVFTDIGTPCEHVTKHFKECHAAFLEANYDEKMLEEGSYPYHLKNRIRGGHGHLSNKQALELFNKHRPPFMSHLFLSHLSKNNNCPVLVKTLFDAHARGTEIIVASRYEETAVYQIQPGQQQPSKPVKKILPVRQLQFSFT